MAKLKIAEIVLKAVAALVTAVMCVIMFIGCIDKMLEPEAA